MVSAPWTMIEEDSPIIATALHAGHELRPQVARRTGLTGRQRLREEDPYTDVFTSVAATRIVVHRSRFEVDLNRPPEKAVYRKPLDAWGLELWKHPLSRSTVLRSQQLHQQFYREMFALLSLTIARHGLAVVLDIHSYNHRRGGAKALPEPAAENPEVNIGTGSMPAYRWDSLVTAFEQGLQKAHFLGRHLDVRENVKFRGGYFPQWIHQTFPHQVCAIAIEFKKIFMNEWTGEVDRRVLMGLLGAFSEATQHLRAEMARLIQATSIEHPELLRKSV